MNKNIFVFGMFLLLVGNAFAVVSVGETIEVSSTGAVVEATTTPVQVEEVTSTQESTGSTDSPSMGGMILTNADGESVAVGSEKGEIVVVEDTAEAEEAAPHIYQVSAQQGGVVQAQVHSYTGEVTAVQIQAQNQKTLLTVDGSSATTTEMVKVQNQEMYLEKEGHQYQIRVLPGDITSLESEGIKVQDVEIEMHEEKPAYQFTVKEQRNFLWVLPVESETEYVVDAQNGKMVAKSEPWWAFMAPQTQSMQQSFNELASRFG